MGEQTGDILAPRIRVAGTDDIAAAHDSAGLRRHWAVPSSPRRERGTMSTTAPSGSLRRP